MVIENRIPADDHLFEDSFGFLEDTSLADLYLEELHRISQQHHDGLVTRPYPIWRANKGYVHSLEYGILITPESYHPAVDLDKATPEQIIEAATSHHERLRKLGMPVVGHLFEPIDEGSSDFETHPQYPTILVGAKYLTGSRPNDQLDGGRDIGVERLLDRESAERYGFTAEEYEEKLLGPIRSYIEWCRESNQTYMHTGLAGFSRYLYQRRQHTLGVWQPTSLMGRTSYEGNFVPVGSLYAEARDFEQFAKELTGKEEKLEIPLL